MGATTSNSTSPAQTSSTQTTNPTSLTSSDSGWQQRQPMTLQRTSRTKRLSTQLDSPMIASRRKELQYQALPAERSGSAPNSNRRNMQYQSLPPEGIMGLHPDRSASTGSA